MQITLCLRRLSIGSYSLMIDSQAQQYARGVFLYQCFLSTGAHIDCYAVVACGFCVSVSVLFTCRWRWRVVLRRANRPSSSWHHHHHCHPPKHNLVHDIATWCRRRLRRQRRRQRLSTKLFEPFYYVCNMNMRILVTVTGIECLVITLIHKVVSMRIAASQSINRMSETMCTLRSLSGSLVGAQKTASKW